MEAWRFGYSFWIYGKPISPAQAIKLIKIEVIRSTIVRHEATFKETLQSIPNYLQAFEKDYGVGSADVRVNGIIEDTVSLTYFAANCRKTLHYCLQDGD